jgi:hypothetical protein
VPAQFSRLESKAQLGESHATLTLEPDWEKKWELELNGDYSDYPAASASSVGLGLGGGAGSGSASGSGTMGADGVPMAEFIPAEEAKTPRPPAGPPPSSGDVASGAGAAGAGAPPASAPPKKGFSRWFTNRRNVPTMSRMEQMMARV